MISNDRVIGGTKKYGERSYLLVEDMATDFAHTDGYN